MSKKKPIGKTQQHKSKKPRDEFKKTSDEFLFGVNPVIEVFRAKRRKIYELYIVSEKVSGKFSEIIKLAENINVPVTRLSYAELSKLAGTDSHQSVLAKVSPYPLVDISEMMTNKNDGLILILDGIEDPQNLGAIARTALCAGVDGIIIPKDRAAAPVPSASKASAGALEHIKIAKVTNIATTIKELKKNSFWITGLDAVSDSSLYKTDLTSSLAIVIGGEDRGLRDLVRKNCDFIVSIPQKSSFNSLNASVAGAVVLYEVVRQRESII